MERCKRDIDAALSVFPFVFLRAIGTLALLPLDGAFRGALKKLAAAVLMAFLFVPFAHAPTSTASASYFGEIFIGLLLIFPLVLCLHGAAMLGELFDVGRGQSIASFYDPVSNLQQSQMGMFFKEFLWLQFLLAGGLLAYMDCFALSLQKIPAATVPLELSQKTGHTFLLLQVNFLTQIMIAALPLAVIFLFANLMGAFAARVLPQLALYQEVFLLSTILGFFYLWHALLGTDWSFFSQVPYSSLELL